MQNTTKRLLSWLVVMAMVLSMVPVFDLANFAVNSKAADEITAGQANLPEGTQAIIDAAKKIQDADLAAHIQAGTCPICGDGITWKTKTNNTGNWDIGIAATDTSYHFYLDGNNANADTGLIYSGHYNFAQTKAVGQTLCIALINNPVVDLDGYIRVSNKDCELNIMGQGTIKSDGKKADGVTDASEDLGMILIQGGNSTVNLYGGTYIYTGDGDGELNNALPTSGVISMRNDGNVLNIFDGVTMGPETQDRTKHLYNVVLTKGTINMYGGTIQNGVSGHTNASGNVNIASGTIFNLYGGTIKNGYTVLDANAKPYLDKAGATGTAIANIGGNVRNSGGTFNMYGGSLEDGFARNGGNGGGNLGNMGNGKSNILGGTIKGGTTRGNGDNINVVSGTVTIDGTALVESGAEGARGSIYLSKQTTSKLVVNGGVIRGGKGPNGGNINVGENTTLEVNGGIIENGTATGSGGNIMINTGCKITLGEKAIIRGGLAEGYGGNIHSVENFSTSAQVLNGTARLGGGNLNIGGGKELTVAGGTVANGWVTGALDEATGNYTPNGANWGGNIRAWTAAVNVTGGLIYGGARGPQKSAHSANNIGCLATVDAKSAANVAGGTLNLAGGIILGDIGISAPSENANGFTCPGTAVTVSGAPQILDRYTLADGTEVKYSEHIFGLNASHDISGLTASARICVSGAVGKVFTAAYTGTEDLSKVFYSENPRIIGVQNADGAFQLAKKPFVVTEQQPAATLGGANMPAEAWAALNEARDIQAEDMAAHVAAGTCPLCGDVTWKEATYPGQFNTDDTNYHYYIDAETNITYNYNWCTLYGKNQTLCLALLNGNTVKEIGGLIAIRSGSVNSTINIMGNGIIDGKDAKSDKLGLLRTQGTNPTMNLYGGTFIRTFEEVDGAAPKGAVLVAETGTVNIFEGVTLGPDTQDLTKTNYNVRIDAGTVNMYGGTIQNGVSGYADAAKTGLTYRYSGNITMTKANATFNMYGGTVRDGAYKASVPGPTSGGNILGQVDSQFINIYGGTIEGGVADNAGNINLYGPKSKLTAMGGTIKNGLADGGNGGNINLSSAPAEIGGYALIDNGEATGLGGGNIHYGAALLISGGMIRNGKATAASGASGGNLRGTGVLTMTDGTIKDGYCAPTVTGGGNLYASGGQTVNISGGNWIGGEAFNGGNIYIYEGKLVVSGDATVSGGKATNNGGNIYKYGSNAGFGNTNNHYVTIGGNAVVKDGEAGNQGGNISLIGSKLSIADNVQILDGHAKTGGNVIVSGVNRKGAAIPDTDPVKYEYNMERALLEITGGVIKGGTATNATQANVCATNADMVMTGGEIYAADGNTANGGGLRISQSNLYLGGDAFIGRADGIQDCCMQIEPSGKMYIDSSWTGSALVQYNEPFAGGETIVTDGKYYTTWGTYTYAADETTGLVSFNFVQGEGTPFTGTLIQERAPFVAIVPAEDGTVKVANAGVISANGSVWYESTEEALADYDINEDVAIYLSGEATINEDIKLDLAGSKLTLKGAGKVYGIDTRNDGYAHFGEITIDESADITYAAEQTEDGKRYIALLDGNKLSFHRIEMTLTHVTLRTEGTPGMYYKATYQCDSALLGRLEAYGVVLSLANMPGADFETEADLNKATAYDAEDFQAALKDGVVNTNSGAIVGIMKQKNSKEVNTENAERTIYANAYLKLDVTGNGDYTNFMADTENEGKTKADAGFSGVAYSLMDVLAAVNEAWETYSAEEQATIRQFILSWAPYITDEAAALLETLLNKIFG